jgi:hypothetical protein
MCIITCRWDERAVSLLPEYLQIFYVRTLRLFDEFEDNLEPDERYRVLYVKKEVCTVLIMRTGVNQPAGCLASLLMLSEQMKHI